MLRSINGNFHDLNIYDNEQREDLKDNGKFYFLKEYSGPVYYFMLDDDIYYPKWYFERTIEAIEKYQCIVTYHGRKLKGKGLNYFKDHDFYGCLNEVTEDKEIDVAGTGVTAFRTDYFNPTELYKSPFKRMSDLIFSLEAAKQGKKIMLLSHTEFDFRDLRAPLSDSCYFIESKNPERQGKIADEIYDIKQNQQ